MSSSPRRSDAGARREALAVVLLTIAGGVLRLWSVGRLGLVHFDEGIYAMAGTWVLSPGGLGGLDPTVISYAPPGFPILVGLSYGVLGVGDVSAILVSIVAGTLAIPVVGWLGVRTFGPGAGACASAFAAMSGPHLAFSRMALTDASFLLAWLVAIGLGQGFLERPGPGRAAAMGAAVGVAQLFKYNGWLAGGIVVLGAAVCTAVRADDRGARRQLALWGWGLFAALLAAAVYWPWYRFVEAHGGYASLLTHQSGYLGGFSSWPAHLAGQLNQERALSGGFWWLLLTGLVGSLALHFATGDLGPRSGLAAGKVVAAVSLPAFCTFLAGFAMMGSVFVAFVLSRAGSISRSLLVLCIGWAVMAILTPFYHPYARLFLPFQALSWLLMAGVFMTVRATFEQLGMVGQRSIAGVPGRMLSLAAGLWIGPILLAALSPYWSAARSMGEIVGPSDSLRRACRSIASELPRELSSLRLYARPPVTFYLYGVVPLAPQPSAADLFAGGAPGAWALIDSAMIRQGEDALGRLPATAGRWTLVREVPSEMNLPTRLDVDPSAVLDRKSGPSAPLLLFRPKPPGVVR